MTFSKSDHVARSMLILAHVVWEVRRAYPRMELGQLHVLLLVLSQPGVNMSDLSGLTELSRAAVSRNTLALSKRSYLSTAHGGRRRGLDLVTQSPDPNDSRAKRVGPTKRGRALAERLFALLEGGA